MLHTSEDILDNVALFELSCLVSIGSATACFGGGNCFRTLVRKTLFCVKTSCLRNCLAWLSTRAHSSSPTLDHSA